MSDVQYRTPDRITNDIFARTLDAHVFRTKLLSYTVNRYTVYSERGEFIFIKKNKFVFLFPLPTLVLRRYTLPIRSNIVISFQQEFTRFENF